VGVDTIYRDLVNLLDAGQPLAFAVLVETKGSTPQKCGAKAIFLPDGRVLGTLGGGCLEAETRQKALRALETGQPFSFRAVLDDDFGWDDGLICGGAVQTFVEPNPKSRQVFEELTRETRQRRVLVTDTKTGKRAVLAENRIIVEEMPAESHLPKVAELLREPEPEPVSVGEIYFEPVLPKPTLVIFGGGHVGAAVGKLAAWSGFEVIAVDDRPSFANKERFPDAKQVIVDDPAKVAREWPVDEDTFLCIVTRGHRHDAVVLKEVIHRNAGYIGMIGSKRKVRTVMEGFIRDGVCTAEDFRRVHSPMGVAIHSVTVEEIAVSVVAELIATRRGAEHPNSLSVTQALADKMAR
jgi:xanthine dehydrogenase accessory factor